MLCGRAPTIFYHTSKNRRGRRPRRSAQYETIITNQPQLNETIKIVGAALPPERCETIITFSLKKQTNKTVGVSNANLNTRQHNNDNLIGLALLTPTIYFPRI